MTGRHRSRLRWTVLIIAALLAVTAGVWIYRADLAANVAITILEERGLGPVELTVDTVGLHSARAGNLSLYGGAVRAKALTLRFQAGDLYNGRAEAIEIEGLQTAVALDDGGTITVGGRPLPATGDISAFPVTSVALHDARITVSLPDLAVPVRIAGGGRLIGTTFAFEAVATMDAGKGSVLKVLAEGKHDIASGEGTASVTMPTLKLERNSKQPKDLLPALASVLPPMDGEVRAAGIVTWQGRTIVPDLLIHLDEVGFKTDAANVSGFNADIRLTHLSPPAGSLTLRGAQVELTTPRLPAPLELRGTGRLEDQVLTFDLTAKLEAGHGSVLEVMAAGRHQLADGRGKANVTLRTLKFHKTTKQPADLLPALGNLLPPIDGSIRAAGTLSWNGTTVVPDLVVNLQDVAFASGGADFSGLAGDVHVTQFSPLATAPHQVITASVKPGGLPPSTFRLQFELQPKPAVKIEALTSEFAGGKISATSFTVDPAAPAVDTVLHFSAVELERVFRLLNIDGVAGSGRIDGDIRLHVRSGKLVIDQSRLAASGPGELNITSPWLSENIGGGNQSVRDALAALSDFHYETLVIELDRAESGQGSIVLHLNGQNPTSSSLKGQKINFNIRLESNFDRLTEIALQSMTAANQLLRHRQ